MSDILKSSRPTRNNVNPALVAALQGRLFPSLVIKAILRISKSTPCRFHFQKRLLLLFVFGSLSKEAAVSSIITELSSYRLNGPGGLGFNGFLR
jgi:hypothetical protein